MFVTKHKRERQYLLSIYLAFSLPAVKFCFAGVASEFAQQISQDLADVYNKTKT